MKSSLRLLALVVLLEIHAVRADSVDLTVLSADDIPIANATTTIRASQVGAVKAKRYVKLTNEKGRVSQVQPNGLNVLITVEKDRYYDSRVVRQPRDGGIDLSIVLKRILNPIPMYAKTVRVYPKKLDKKIGFDLLASDWVSPAGSGVVADFYMEMSHGKRNGLSFTQSLKITFNSPLEGIIELSSKDGHFESAYPYIYTAPSDGYRSYSEIYLDNSEEKRIYDTESRTFSVLRTRVVEVNGEIAQAHYSKIFPEIRLIGGLSDKPGAKFTYYFNPTPNDTNLEFDTSKNLFKRLGHREKVKKP